MMSINRIDTRRNQLVGTRDLLTMILEEIEDLHVLAYDRPVALSEAKVSGGSHDYALDTHGDPRARSAYHQLGRTVDSVCKLLDEASTNALNLLREGRSPGRGQRHLRLAELGEAISSQARRARRGDYTPIRRGPQPDQLHALDQMRKERDEARLELAKITKQRDKAREDLARKWRGQAGSSTS
jgi:hypothetical protein